MWANVCSPRGKGQARAIAAGGIAPGGLVGNVTLELMGIIIIATIGPQLASHTQGKNYM